MIAASGVSENLISIRRFAEAGFSIYMDEEFLDIYDKETGMSYMTGTYEAPNWLVKMVVESKTTDDFDCSEYACVARFTSLDDFLRQSQSDVLNLEATDPEGAPEPENGLHHSETGRENGEKSQQSDVNSDCLDWELRGDLLGNRILDPNKPEDLLKIEELVNEKNESSKYESENLNHPSKLDLGSLWHARLGDPSLKYLNHLKRIVSKLRDIKFHDGISDCETCILAKMKRLPFSEVRTRAERPLKLIHTDTIGPIKPQSYPGGNKFITTFIDDYSRFAKIYSVKHKDESGMCLESYLRTTRNLIGKDEKVCFIRADRGTDFTGGEFHELMEREKIDSNFTPGHTPQLNGTAERFNLTLQERTRALMFDSGIPTSMWILAVEVAVYMYNRTPNKSIDFESPIRKLAP